MIISFNFRSNVYLQYPLLDLHWEGGVGDGVDGQGKCVRVETETIQKDQLWYLKPRKLFGLLSFGYVLYPVNHQLGVALTFPPSWTADLQIAIPA